MLYVGVHKGTIDDGYIASGKFFMQEYRKRPEDFVRQIISCGNYSEMRVLESKILESVDAKRNPFFYNQHNSDGKFYLKFHTDESKIKMSISKKGRPGLKQSKETIDKKASKIRGVKKSEETKKKISIAAKGRILSEETKEKIRNSCKGLPSSMKGKKYYNNGKLGKLYGENDIIPVGWTPGKYIK